MSGYMAQSIPGSFHVAALARVRAAFEGAVAVERVARFRDLLADGPAEVTLKLQFSVSPMGPAQAVGRLGGSVPQTCQRCLQTVMLELDQPFRFALVDSDRAEGKLPEDMDRLRLDENGRISLSELIEDELILSLPQIPWHPAGQCDGQVASMLDGLKSPVEETETRRPFSGLDALLKNDKPESD